MTRGYCHCKECHQHYKNYRSGYWDNCAPDWTRCGDAWCKNEQECEPKCDCECDKNPCEPKCDKNPCEPKCDKNPCEPKCDKNPCEPKCGHECEPKCGHECEPKCGHECEPKCGHECEPKCESRCVDYYRPTTAVVPCPPPPVYIPIIIERKTAPKRCCGTGSTATTSWNGGWNYQSNVGW